MSIEAMKQAIEALKSAQNNLASSKGSAHAFGDGELWDLYANAITSLRQAIEEADKQEKTVRKICAQLCKEIAKKSSDATFHKALECADAIIAGKTKDTL